MRSEEILKKVEEVLKEEGLEFDSKMGNDKILNEFIIPGLQNSKNTLQSLYGFQGRARGGFFGKLKSLFQNKIINTCVNVIEKQSIRQQKFNELTYKAIETLVEENRILREEIEKLNNNKSD